MQQTMRQDQVNTHKDILRLREELKIKIKKKENAFSFTLRGGSQN